MERKTVQIPEYLIFFLVFALIIFGIFGILYIVQIPLFEGYDEIAHYYRIVEGNLVFSMPDTINPELLELEESDKKRVAELQENLGNLYFPFSEKTLLSFYQLHQPPLYYDMLSFIHQPNRNERHHIFVNPYFMDKYANLFISKTQGSINYRNLAKDVRIYRFISNIFMLSCVFVSFLIFRSVFTGRTLVVFTGLFALLSVPQFIFTGSIINNDIMLLFFSFLSLYLFQLIIVSHYNNALVITLLLILLPLGIFVKLSFISLIISFSLFYLLFQRDSKKKYLMAFLGLTLFTVLAIYALDRGFIINLYTRVHNYFYTIRRIPYDSISLLSFFRDVFKSFFGVFGWKNVYLRRFDYIVYLLITILFIYSLMKNILLCIKKKQKKQDLFLFNLTVIIVNLLLFSMYYIISKQPQGRFLFISLPSFIIIILLAIHENRAILIFFCILFFSWGVYINSYVTCIMLPERYAVTEPLYFSKQTDKDVFQLIPGLGFRNFNSCIVYYDLARFSILSNRDYENLHLRLIYSTLPDRLKQQLIINPSDNMVYNPAVEKDCLIYTVRRIKSGRNDLYLYNSENRNDNRIYNNRNLIRIEIE